MTNSLNTSLEDEMASEAARQLQEEIDWEIITDLMEQIGWYKVVLSTTSGSFLRSLNTTLEIKTWVEQNVEGKYKSRCNVWVFEREQDAMTFILRWA